MPMMHRNQSVSTHKFAMVPRAEIPRASFKMQRALKSTFDGGYLVPVLCEEILPGDSFRVKMTAFVRLATPLFPVMDNMYLDSFFFFVPNRLVWTNWTRFMGEQIDGPTDSISYVIPQTVSPADGYAVNELQDYFGLPTVGQLDGDFTHSSLPLRGYNLIYNEWFRDENLQFAVSRDIGDGPDDYNDFVLLRRGKRHDYFTSCLPWPQKGGTAVTLPLGTSAPVKVATLESQGAGASGSGTGLIFRQIASGTAVPANRPFMAPNAGVSAGFSNAAGALVQEAGSAIYPSNLYADLSAATAATINQLRQSFQVQKLLERDARGGTRYTEIVRAHFGVISPDARLQRPEYLGGGSTPIIINPVAQNSATQETEFDEGTPLGTLGGVGTALASHGFSQSFTEHGYVIGLVSVRADMTYQQGLRRHWSRSTRYDFYFPAFAMLGEQAVLRKEIYCTGVTNLDDTVFGYQERWAEYRYSPSEITGLFRSTAAGSLDAWHLAQNFVAPPVLNPDFIEETPPIDRILAVGADANGKQFLFDSFWDIQAARPMPLYSVPGLIDHF